MLNKLTNFFRKNKSSYPQKKTLYLHVGMDKTGTSAIQSFLHKNKDKLLSEANILYPKTGMWNDYSHHVFAFSCMEMHGYTLSDFDELCAELQDEMKGADSVLLSSECLFKLPTKNPGFESFFRFVNDNFAEVKVIIYLRRQDKWVISRHKHSVISGQELSIEMLCEPYFCDYKQYIDKWAEHFDKRNIIVRPYEKSSFTGGDIFSDFMTVLGIEQWECYASSVDTVNTALNNNEYYFKRLCNLIGLREQNADELNIILLEHSANSKAHPANTLDLMSNSEKIELMRRYAAVNASIAAEYLPDGSDKLFVNNMFDASGSVQEKYTGIVLLDLMDIKSYICEKSESLYKQIDILCSAALASDSKEVVMAAELLIGKK